MSKKKSSEKQQPVKLPDLTPRKDAKGGGLAYSKEPPLAIPPPGFFSSQRSNSLDGER